MLQDLRFALRQLLKNPGFGVVAIVTLALAIGAATAIFSAVDAVLLHPLPYPHPEQLVIVRDNLRHFGLRDAAPSPPEFIDYRRMANSFSYATAAKIGEATLTGGGQPEEVSGVKVTASAFPMLGITPVLGGLFTSENEQYGKDRVAILSEGLWKRRFGGDRSIIGKNIQINRESYRVAGVIRPVLDPIFDVQVATDVLMPLAFAPEEVVPGSNRPHYIETIARLNSGVTIEKARDEFRRIAARMSELYPDQYPKTVGFSIDVDPFAGVKAGNLRNPLLALIFAVAAIMLIACANVSNLLLSRATMRRKEIGIRSALGGSRARVIRQLSTESLLLAALAGAAGLALALAGLHLYEQFGPPGLIHGTQPAINGWVAGFAVLLSILATIVFGLAPAIETSHISLNDALKRSSGGSGRDRRLFRESMVALEVAASLILLIGASLLVRSLIRMESADPGFRPENVLTAVIPLPMNQYRKPAQRSAFASSLLDRVRAIPGVLSASNIDYPPLAGAGSHIEIPGHPQPANQPTVVAFQARISPEYFKTLGIPLLRGRDLETSDDQGTPTAAVIDEATAKRFFANLDPIGMQIVLPIPNVTATIVGIVGAIQFLNPTYGPRRQIYYSGPAMPFPQVTLAVRTAGDPLALVPAIRHELASIDSALPLSHTITMDQQLADSVARQRFTIQLMSVFAAIAAVLAAIGIYGVLAYLVDQRRREFGIRIALGARPGDVVSMVLRQGAAPVAIGLVAGIAGALALTRLLKSLLYEVSATDPATFIMVSFGLIVVALAAMSIPALRASRVDPVEALRQE